MKEFTQILDKNSQCFILTYSLKACPHRMTQEAMRFQLKTQLRWGKLEVLGTLGYLLKEAIGIQRSSVKQKP